VLTNPSLIGMTRGLYMRLVKFLWLLGNILLITTHCFAQISTKTGTIYGKLVDDTQAPMPGVTIALNSDLIPTQLATSGANGAFRFVNLPPGTYSLRFTLQGFADVEQQDVRVKVGGSVELVLLMKPSLEETVTVLGEAPLVDTRKTGSSSTYSAESVVNMPNGRDPWFIVALTPGVDSSRLNTISGSNAQASFFSRGGKFENNVWNYDGVSHTDAFGGASPTYYDFDALAEIQISTAGNDPSIQTGGVAINLVSKRAGNRWTANGSFYFANEDMQSNNTPDELKANPQTNPDTGLPAKGSNRIKEINDYGLDLGGPILKDKFFVWGAYRHHKIEEYDVTDLVHSTNLIDYNFKLNFSWNKENETQGAFFKGLKEAHRFFFPPSQMAPESAWDQKSTPGQGIWTATHTWIPNDHVLTNARYGYIGSGFELLPVGGTDVPVIYLAAIQHWENTYLSVDPSEQPAHDVNADVDYFKENLLGGDHEFRFGFEYKNTNVHTFSSYGNGVFIYDYDQTTPGGPLTSGYLNAEHAVDFHVNMQRASVYGMDTYRINRLTLNLGLRFDYQTGTNKASSEGAVAGFEEFVGPFSYSGGDPGIHFDDFSPRVGAVFDLTGKGTTIIRGNFARYYDSLSPKFVAFTNPTLSYNGAMFAYANRNNDRVITSDEIIGGPQYYGGLTENGFDLNKFLQNRTIDPNFSNGWTNEFLVGFEHQLMSDLSIAANYVYRKYGNLTPNNDPLGFPVGVSTSDYVPGGTFKASTVFGDFSVPYFILPFPAGDESILTNIHNYTQTYNGLELVVNKRMSHHFQLNGSVTIQSQKGHYNGGDSLAFVITGSPRFTTGSTAPFDPTNLPFLQGKPYAYKGLGSLIYPFSEWAIKLSGICDLPWGLTAGAYLRYQQGYPYVIVGTVRNQPGEDPHLILVEPIGSRRYKNLFTLDLHTEKQFHAGNSTQISALVDIFNITNENTVLNRAQRISSNLNKIQEVLAPRVVRLGLRLGF
jgi:hypothetical protein